MAAQAGVDVAPEPPRLDPDLLPAVLHLQGAEVARHLDEQAVADRLAREAGAGGPEGHGDAPLLAEPEEPTHLVDVLRVDHGPGDEAGEAPVVGLCPPLPGAIA